MNSIDTLFVLGSLFAFFAGFSEIVATKNRWLSGQKQNFTTPFFMVLVKLTRLPKFVSMYDGSLSSSFPMVSAIAAAMIWGISLVYTLLPLHHHTSF